MGKKKAKKREVFQMSKKNKKSELKKKALILMNDVGFYLFVKGLGVRLAYYNKRTALRKLLYCKRGWHSFGNEGEMRSISGYLGKNVKQKEIKVHYFKCQNCGRLFFLNKEDRDKYVQIEEIHNGLMENIVKIMVKNAKEGRGMFSGEKKC